jgi:MFS transporter, OPA family, glycerol-3-phosphate transporter
VQAGDDAVGRSTSAAGSRLGGWVVVAVLGIGYIGVYLCRKNLSVAVPLLQQEFGASKADVGVIASVGTFAYAAGKLLNGVLVDRVGGRTGFLAALAAVALFGALGAFSPTLGVLSALYGLNRFAGSAGWGAMVKIVPTWFGVTRSATVIGVMSLSYVLGGVAATLLARQIVTLGGGWRQVMGYPSIVLLVLILLCVAFVRTGPLHPPAERRADSPAADRWAELRELVRKPQFIFACAVSFAVTLLRDSFNHWSVDFLTEAQGQRGSVATAALHSVGFDLAGAVAILGNGFLYDRIKPEHRGWLVASSLGFLALVLLVLPAVASSNLLLGAFLLGAVGLLVYGPFSLLSGVIAIETGGAKQAATAAGVIDGVGYLGAIFAGYGLGKLLDIGGYSLGLRVLAVVTAIATMLSLGLRGPKVQP